MTEKEIEKMLWEFPKVQVKLKDILTDISSIRVRIDTIRGIKSPVIDGLPHGSGISDNTYKSAQIIVDEYDFEMSDLLRLYDETLRHEKEMKELLKRLTERECRIIELYYFEGRRWTYISNVMYWHVRTCQRTRDKAIKKMID